MTPSPIYNKDPLGANTLEVIGKARQFNKWMFRVIQPHIKGRVLEIGSGLGNISTYLLEYADEITLSDLNTDYCDWLRQKFPNSPGLKEIVTIDLVHPDFTKQYQRFLGQFDSIILLNVIEHIKDHDLAAQNAKSLLSEKGVLIMLAPAFSFLYCSLDKYLGHHRRYTRSSMQQLLENNGYKVKKATYFNFTGIAGWFLFGKLLSNKEIKSQEVGIYEKLVPFNRLLDIIMHRFMGLSIFCIGEKQF